MNWKTFIKQIESEHPKLTPKKLYDFISRMYGSRKKTKLSDKELIKSEWARFVVKSIKNFNNVPRSARNKKLSMEKRINYFIKGKNFRFSWAIFHPQYYNDKVRLADKNGKPTDQFVIEKTLGPREISDVEFRKINHTNNIRQILKRNKIK